MNKCIESLFILKEILFPLLNENSIYILLLVSAIYLSQINEDVQKMKWP